MALTLYWYMLRDMLKVLAATLGVLVVVMAFGFAMKPLSEGMLGPWQLAKVTLFTMPGMVTFALPFAAAMGSTMTFFRMSADNEITACSAGGLSYRELLTPVLVLGLVLTATSFWLSNWVVPRFWKQVAMEVEQDVARMVVTQIHRRDTVQLGHLTLYADWAQDRVPIEARPPGEPVPYNRMLLRGVAVGKMSGPSNELQGDYTADQAVVDFYRDPADQHTYVTMLLSGVTVNEPDSGRLFSVERQPVDAQEIPSPLMTKPKFLSLPQLQDLRRHPWRSPEIRQQKQRLAELLAGEQLLEQVQQRMQNGDHTLPLTNFSGQKYDLTAPLAAMVHQKLSLRGKDGIKVVAVTQNQGRVTKLEADGAQLEVVLGALDNRPRLNLTLSDVQVYDGLRAPSRLKQVPLPLMQYDGAKPMQDMSLAQLMQACAGYPGGAVARARRGLSNRLRDLMRDIVSRLHERAGMAVNCVLVIVLGAVMSMKLRNQTPLTIFFWCFMPTLVAVLTISSGHQMIGWANTSPWVGIAMLWAGNVALLGLVLGVYRRLCRN